MSLLCCVIGCSNGNEQYHNPQSKFFPFPSVKETQGPRVEELTRRRRMAWVFAVNRPGISLKHVSPHSYVCSRHFHKGQPAYETLDTDLDWAPSLCLGHPEEPTNTKKSSNTGIKRSRLQMALARERKSIKATFLIQNECCVVKCGGKSHNDRGQRIRNGLTFFPFPVWRKNNGVFISDLTRRQREAWVKAVGRADITFDDVPDEARVCSRHFISEKPAYEMKDNDPDWAPTLLLKNEKSQQPPVVRNPSPIRRKPMKKKSNQTVSPKANEEKPSAVPWKDMKSRLQGLMREKEQPMEMPQVVVDENVQNFEDFIRNALKASLDACSDPGSQSHAEPGLSLDPSWFSVAESSPLSSVRGRLTSPSASPASEAPCENCVRLQERIAELEERLAAPQYMQGCSKWTQPLSQTDLEPGQGRLLASPETGPFHKKGGKFLREWLLRYWFLRYSARLNVMWCHVCRMYGREDNRSTFVKGTRVFQTTTIIQHSRSSYHQECVRIFRSRKERVQPEREASVTM